MKRLLVLGGTGFVGSALCGLLAERLPGTRVVVPTRRAPKAAGVQSLPNVDVMVENVHDDAALARLVAGCDAVVNLIAILHGSTAEFDRVHVALPRRLAAACKTAGVARLVHVSALGVGEDPPSKYLASKTAGEAVLKASGLQLTLLRPSVIFGAHDRFMNLFAQLQSVAPVLPLAGREAQLQPVWVEDVCRAIVECLLRPSATAGQAYECAGPGVYTLGRLVYLAGLWSGHARTQFTLPAPLGRLQALAMEMMPGEPLMSRDNLDSMKRPNVATGRAPGLEALGIVPTPMEAVVPGYLGELAGRGRMERWRAAARRD